MTSIIKKLHGYELFLLIFLSFLSFNVILAFQHQTIPDQNNLCSVQKSGVNNTHIELKTSISEKSHTTDDWLDNMNLNQSGEYFDGYNIFQLRTSSADRFVIMNMDGFLVQETLVGEEQGAGMVIPINSTTMLLQSSNTFIYLWNIYTDEKVLLPFVSHHDVSFNPTTETFMTLVNYDIEIGGDIYRYDRLIEKNRTGHVIWELNTADFVGFVFNATKSDITHANAVFWDTEEDMIYLNLRDLNTFYKINYRTKQVVWSVGELGNLDLYDINGIARSGLFNQAHALEIIDDNRFLLFDNKYIDEETGITYSRLLEIVVDEKNEIAREVWTWEAPSEYRSSVHGDADSLPNGNRMGTFAKGARIVEVNNAGQIVWEMNFPNTFETDYNIYQADRIHFSPIINSPDDIEALSTDNVSINWQAWYNFRAKYSMNGSYSLYLDDEIIDNGTVKYDKFWRPTVLDFTLGKIEKGLHSVELVIADESGHESRNSVSINVKDFHISREGSLDVENGQPDIAEIDWTGKTASTLNCELYHGTSIIDSFSWTGERITLDVITYETGTHAVSLLLYNNSILVYNDSFTFTVHESTPPEFISHPGITELGWNQSELLTWSVFDYSPSNWSIIVNDTEIITQEWDTPHHDINWMINAINDGFYNITVVLNDKLGLHTVHTLWIEVHPASKPFIAHTPDGMIYNWNTEGVSLTWNVYGADRWKLWKNGSMIFNGTFINNKVTIVIENWRDNDWRPGKYNLTLEVFSADDELVKHTSWADFQVQLVDAYANAVLLDYSIWFSSGDRAIGQPDGQYAIVYPDYMNGFLTLDMGNSEEIIDGDGDDFEIIATGGEYLVYVFSDLEAEAVLLGSGSGNESFDLHLRNIDRTRFIRIEFYSAPNVQLDAIIALNFAEITADDNEPIITEISDFSISKNQDIIVLEWIIEEDTPWNYSIFVDGQLAESGSWYGSNIHFSLSPDKLGKISVTLWVGDAFGNTGKTTTIIEIIEIISTSEQTSTDQGQKTPGFPFLSWLIVFVMSTIYRSRKEE